MALTSNNGSVQLDDISSRGLNLRENLLQGFILLIMYQPVACRLSETSPQRHKVTKVTKVTLHYWSVSHRIPVNIFTRRQKLEIFKVTPKVTLSNCVIDSPISNMPMFMHLLTDLDVCMDC